MKNSLRLSIHLPLLILFLVVAVCVWMLPVIAAGGPTDIAPLLLARNFAATHLFSVTDALGRFLAPDMLLESGIPSAFDGRLSTMFIAFLSQWISWDNQMMWTLVSCLIMSGALFFWWLTVARIRNVQEAWVSTVLMAFLPLYYQQAIAIDEYKLAFLFLFASFAAFVWLYKSSTIAACIVSGILFGLSIASKDVFLIFVPWFVLWHVWTKRKKWKKAVGLSFLFLFFSGLVYITPYLGDIQKYGYPININLARVWPSAETIQEDNYLHLYPDPYTYFFDRERFDAEFVENLKSATLIQKLQSYKVMQNFDVGNPSLLLSLFNSSWIFVHHQFNWFHQPTVGGIFMWLFILIGIAVLWKKEKQLVYMLLGLMISTELVIRFILHYARDHTMDTAWVLVLFAAIGAIEVANLLSAKWKKVGSTRMLSLLVLLLSLHLLQVNRAEFGRVYAKATTSSKVTVAKQIQNTLNPGSIIAVPYSSSVAQQLSYLSERTLVIFAPETVTRLIEEGKLEAIFEMYGITHLAGYEHQLVDAIQRELPNTPELLVDTIKPSQFKNTRFQRYLLHLFR